MPEPELLALFIEPLHRTGLRYMVTGSLAAIAYGEPRLTLDVDLVLDLDPQTALGLPLLFSAPAFYCPPADVLTIECRRAQRGHFNLLHVGSGLKADVYLAGRDPLHRWALDRRREIDVDGQPVWFAPPEYVILRKLQYLAEGGSEKHPADIRGILRCSGARLDMDWLHGAIERHGLASAWAKCRPDDTGDRPS